MCQLHHCRLSFRHHTIRSLILVKPHPRPPANAAKIGLGTVQFGASYGHYVPTAQVTPDQVRRIAELARASHVHTVDTAAAYGNAEEVVGHHFPEPFRTVTKLPPIPSAISSDDAGAWVRACLDRSMHRLRREHIYGLLLHNPDDLLGEQGNAIALEMERLQDSGLVKRIGVSVYAPSDLERVTQVLKPGLVQCPYNYFDRRIEDSGWADRLKSDGCEIHTRSAFLQGVLLLEPRQRRSNLAPFSAFLSDFDQEVTFHAGNRVAAALSGPLAATWCDAVIIGAANANQFSSILRCAAITSSGFRSEPSAPSPDILIDPRLW